MYLFPLKSPAADVWKQMKNKMRKYTENRCRLLRFGVGVGGWGVGGVLIKIAFECAHSSGNTGAHRSGIVK